MRIAHHDPDERLPTGHFGRTAREHLPGIGSAPADRNRSLCNGQMTVVEQRSLHTGPLRRLRSDVVPGGRIRVEEGVQEMPPCLHRRVLGDDQVDVQIHEGVIQVRLEHVTLLVHVGKVGSQRRFVRIRIVMVTRVDEQRLAHRHRNRRNEGIDRGTVSDLSVALRLAIAQSRVSMRIRPRICRDRVKIRRVRIARSPGTMGTAGHHGHGDRQQTRHPSHSSTSLSHRASACVPVQSLFAPVRFYDSAARLVKTKGASSQSWNKAGQNPMPILTSWVNKTIAATMKQQPATIDPR